jgi:hypothetical protein
MHKLSLFHAVIATTHLPQTKRRNQLRYSMQTVLIPHAPLAVSLWTPDQWLHPSVRSFAVVSVMARVETMSSSSDTVLPLSSSAIVTPTNYAVRRTGTLWNRQPNLLGRFEIDRSLSVQKCLW